MLNFSDKFQHEYDSLEALFSFKGMLLFQDWAQQHIENVSISVRDKNP